MKHAHPLAALVLALLLIVPTTGCKAATQALESTAELGGDAWLPAISVAIGFLLGGPIGAAVGGTFGGAYAVGRAKLYSARDLAKAYERGEIFGRQQARDLADAARGARLDRVTVEAQVVPWYRRWGWQLVEAVVLVLTLTGFRYWGRVIFGPNRLRAVGHIYLRGFCPMPKASG